MCTTYEPEAFMSLRRTAARLGVPIAWLKTEAEARRIPSLRAGRRLLFNPEAVEQVLLERAAGTNHEGRGDA